MENKHCKHCGLTKDINEFRLYRYNLREYRQTYCKSCCTIRNKAWLANNPDKAQKYNKNKYHKYRIEIINGTRITVASKQCPKCDKILAASHFYIANSSDGLSSYCKFCFIDSCGYSRDKRRWMNMRSWDRTKGYAGTLSYEEWQKLIIQPCAYCNFASITGLDRINNDRGHSADNVLPCCEECNEARNIHWSVEIMRTIIGPAIAQARIARDQSKTVVQGL